MTSKPQPDTIPAKSTSAAPLLEITDLSLSFGGLKAVQNFTFGLPRGALFGLIGPNGAGKTTVFNLLTGVYRPDGGAIRLDAQNLVGRKPHEIAAAGMARTLVLAMSTPIAWAAISSSRTASIARPMLDCLIR